MRRGVVMHGVGVDISARHRRAACALHVWFPIAQRMHTSETRRGQVALATSVQDVVAPILNPRLGNENRTCQDSGTMPMHVYRTHEYTKSMWLEPLYDDTSIDSQRMPYVRLGSARILHSFRDFRAALDEAVTSQRVLYM